MVRYRSRVAVLGLTDAHIILQGKKKFFLLSLTTLSMKGFCIENFFVGNTFYMDGCVQ